MERAAYTKEQLLAYDRWKIDILTERGMIDDALKKGEAKKAIFIAKNLLKKGMSIEEAADMTGLSIEQIRELNS